jgi:hypothetical protein
MTQLKLFGFEPYSYTSNVNPTGPFGITKGERNLSVSEHFKECIVLSKDVLVPAILGPGIKYIKHRRNVLYPWGLII